MGEPPKKRKKVSFFGSPATSIEEQAAAPAGPKTSPPHQTNINWKVENPMSNLGVT
jgi:hypothetical protein